MRGMMIFANVHTKDFVRTYPELIPDDFTVKYYAASHAIERAVSSEGDYLAHIENTWENNHLEEYRKIVELENETDERHTLFVYGSLMKDRYNHDAFMRRAVYLGVASILGFAFIEYIAIRKPIKALVYLAGGDRYSASHFNLALKTGLERALIINNITLDL